ncbi:MAG: single-stranded DNA-binding protein [Chloroflexi bacterium]|nr:MAG: single-stranded DNA-binding protein [Chloroflexota bacterium]
MSRGFSRVILIGNLGRDPEMRYSQSGIPITNFSLAVNRRRRQADGNFADETSWYRVSLYRNQAESAIEWLKKGSRVLVEGQLRVRTYVGQDGVERTSVEVDADNFQNLTPRGEDMGGAYPPAERTPYEREREGGRAPHAGQPSGGRPPEGPRYDQYDDDDMDDVPF